MELFWQSKIILTLVTFMVQPSYQQHALQTSEVCSDEAFNTRCGTNEVILVETAYYGRRYSGRCVQKKVEQDCEDSVKQWASSQCSGKQVCSFTVTKTNPYLKSQKPCSEELTWHMYLTYQCIKVAHTAASTCRGSTLAPINSFPGYITSSVARKDHLGLNLDPLPGSSDCQWEIKAKQGQKIQLSAFNFMTPYAPGKHSTASCNNFAKVREQKMTVHLKICSSAVSPKLLYTSTTNVIQLYFTENVLRTWSNYNNHTEYLIKYEVIGCADLPKVNGAHFIRSGDDLQVKCNSTSETWYLTCDGVSWRGRLSNCSVSAVDQNKEGWTMLNDGFPYGLVLVVAVGVALGILLGGTTLIIISYRMKRKHQPHYEMPPEHCLNYNTSGSMRSVKVSKNPNKPGIVNPHQLQQQQQQQQQQQSFYTGTNTNPAPIIQGRQWAELNQPPPSIQHQQNIPPDYNFNPNTKREQTIIDNAHSAPHLYESPHVTS